MEDKEGTEVVRGWAKRKRPTSDYGSRPQFLRADRQRPRPLTDRDQEPMRAENFLRLEAASPITTLANSSTELGSGTALVAGIVIEVKVADCEVLLA